jgi:hypothetical protein
MPMLLLSDSPRWGGYPMPTGTRAEAPGPAPDPGPGLTFGTNSGAAALVSASGAPTADVDRQFGCGERPSPTRIANKGHREAADTGHTCEPGDLGF